MNREEAIAAAKEHLEEYLQQQGINTRQNFYCLNPAHTTQQDHTGAKDMSYHRPSNRVVCHCGASYDLLDLMELQQGAHDFNEALETACRLFDIPLDGKPEPLQKKSKPRAQEEDKQKQEQTRKLIEQAQANIEDEAAIAYLNKRGISLETAKAYGLGYLPSFKTAAGTWRALIIPTGSYNLTARNIDSKGKEDRVQHRGEGKTFNEAALSSTAEAVHIVEGEIDALSVIEAGGQAVALCSTSYTRQFLDVLSRFKVPFSKTLILSLDNDEAGTTAEIKLLNGLLKMREDNPLFEAMKVICVNISGEYKDPNEALLANREAFIAKVAQRVDDSALTYRKHYSAGSLLLGFYEGITESVNTPAIPTGYSFLDEQLDGGLYEGLYTIPAISSLGKTTFALQMAEAIAKQGKDVLYISLEMAANELIAKAISRLTFLQAIEKGIDKRNAKTVRGITDGKRYERYNAEETALIMGAYDIYSTYADHLYIYEGIGDLTAKRIRNIMEQHLEATGNIPVLFVDYLQILAPADVRATDKQNMDKAALELKRISRDYKTPVVVLSSVNRINYHEPISLEAIKESGAIEYGSDTVIGLQLEGAGSKEARKDPKEWVNEQMKQDPRRVEAVILKNRNGARGAHLYFDYYAMFNLFYERERPAQKAYIEDED